MPYLPQKVYEWLRWIIAIVIPAAIVCFGVIGNVLDIPNTETILTIAGAVQVFLGTIFGISKIRHDKQKELEG